MHTRRIRRIPREKRRVLLLCFFLLMLGAIIAACLALRPGEETEDETPLDASVVLQECDTEALMSLTIQRGHEEPWTAEAVSATELMILGEDSYILTADESRALMEAACHIPADVLTENPADYADHLADFGLDAPRYTARIEYRDGRTLTLRVGNASHEGTWRYMLIDGDDRLFAFANGDVESLFVNRDTLRKITQPALHKARIDQITLTGPEGIQAQWRLTGKITDLDAIDRWQISQPITYPADAAAMATLLSNVANLRLGAYVCPAAEDRLTAYGFDRPRLTIDIHMTAGMIATTTADGSVETTQWPASTVTFVIGGAKNDMVDYILYNGSIYLSSHFTMGMFLDYDVKSTMSRYPVMTALGNLASLTIHQDNEVAEYVLIRTEQVAENNELVTDADGHVVYDVALTLNGVPADYAAFETAYSALTLVTVSGMLPEGEYAAVAPHTVYTFTDVDGTVHTVALATFDVLHDAIIVNGHQVFYLIKGGFRLNME